jgi:Phasin protein
MMKGKLSMTATESSKQMKDTNSPTADANFVVPGGSQFLENLIKSNSTVMKNSFEITQEMLTFSQERLLANLEAWNAFSACRNPGDLPAYQVEFATKATAQYADITSKLANRLISGVSRIAVPIGEQTLKS